MAGALPEHDRNEVLAVHEQFWQAYAQRDLDRRFAVCAPDVTFVGTGRHERANGITAYRAMNERGVQQYPSPFRIDMLSTAVHGAGDMAWVECDSLWVKQEPDRCTRDEVRLTTVLRRAEGRWWVCHVHGSVPDLRLHEGEYLLHADMSWRNAELERQVAERTRELQLAKDAADDMLRNILPASVVNELHQHNRVRPRLHPQVTVIFADFKGFTHRGELLGPERLVEELNDHFTAFDNLLSRFRVEKIKTMGDAYMAAAGLPDPDADHAAEALRFALAIRDIVRERRERLGPNSLGMRVGLHSGEVVAGIVGLRKFAYDIWGDTVNTAARMQEACPEGHVNISATTHALVKDRFMCLYRGEIEAKNKGPMRMYLVGSQHETMMESTTLLPRVARSD
ncbi:MAG: nuclear transport factor 2 family protein [Flavobacteriales bacterium]|nr:nuclear transport factor 2 family protein [Flavobacteriales bacterium]